MPVFHERPYRYTTNTWLHRRCCGAIKNIEDLAENSSDFLDIEALGKEHFCAFEGKIEKVRANFVPQLDSNSAHARARITSTLNYSNTLHPMYPALKK